MRKKSIILLIMAAVLTLPLFASTPVSLKKKPGPNTGSRSEDVVTASIDEQLLTVSFSNATASSIVVYDATDHDAALFSQNYSPAYSAQADLTSLPAGDYVVEIYAFGYWWIGYFEIE